METTDLLMKGGAAVIMVAGAAIDLQTRRIPNHLTFGGALLGLVANIAAFQADGIRWSLGGWLVGVLLLAIPFALRGPGAGDVKLLAGAGAWGGPFFVIYAFCFGAIAGGVVALWLLRERRRIGQVGHSVGDLGRELLVAVRSRISPQMFAVASASCQTGSDRPVIQHVYRFPYGPALAVGGLIALLVR